MYYRFPSIAAPEKHGYAYDSGQCKLGAGVHVNFRMFQTYGDGMVQHSHCWAVTPEYLADYLVSLTQAMLADADLADKVNYILNQKPRREEIAFAASVVFKADGDSSYEKKSRYFSLQEQKISSSDSKRHDKRYERIQPHHDGSAGAILAMLLPGYMTPFDACQYYRAIADWCGEEKGRPYAGWACSFMKWECDRYEVDAALDAARAVCDSYRQLAHAKQAVERFKRNEANRAELAAAAKTQAITEAAVA